MLGQLRIRLAVVAFGLLLGACLPTQTQIHWTAGDIGIRGYSCPTPPCEAYDNTAKLTGKHLNATYRVDSPDGSPPDRSYVWSYLDERKWFKRGDEGFKRANEGFKPGEGPPRLCLAMSGGGLRSAAVNIGVLGALYTLRDDKDKPLLDRIDIISGVSGGSSALAWYYAQHLHLDAVPPLSGDADPRQQMFADETSVDEASSKSDTQHQDYLANHYVTFTDPEYGAGFVMNSAFIPLNLFANGVFGWHANTSPMRGWYESRLRETFLRDPRSDGHTRTGTAISLADLGRVTAKRDLPLPIISASALIERDFQHFGARLGNIVFEFTPAHFGSDAFGRHPYDTDAGTEFDLSRVVSISSAAFDGALLVSGPTQTALWSALNSDTGMYVHNPSLSSTTRFWHRWLPFPFYFSDHYLRDVKGTDIYLSDGGHSENLAMYPLVRRRCSRIIVVDAEHDPGYIFDAYLRLKRSLKAEMGVNFDVAGIHKILDIADHSHLGPRWTQATQEPVMRGSVSTIPYRKDDGTTVTDEIRVLYIKMAFLPEMKLPLDTRPEDDPLRQEVRARWKDVGRVFSDDLRKPCILDPQTGLHLKGTCPFPHRTTKDQSFKAHEYRAWRNLGRILAIGYSTAIREFVLD